MVAAATLASLLMVNCGGDEAADVPSTLEFNPTTTEAPTTTTEATTTEPPTTAASLPTAPLTGLPSADADNLARPALVVKIDNHPDARPQTGLELADIVFDLRAESVTRFTAVFHSQTPDPVGPVRSSRTSDFDLLSGLDTPLYASSGGNDFVMSALRRLPVTAVTNQSRREYFRGGEFSAPHNLYANASDLFALAPADPTPPQPWFAFRGADDDLSSTAVPFTGEAKIAFRDGPTTGFSWDANLGAWPRTQSGQPHLTVSGVQIAPANVVIMETTYGVSAADPVSPELRSTGSGALTVLTDGHSISGTWERANATDKPTLLDADGQPIALTPGQTWVLYPEAGQTTLG